MPRISPTVHAVADYATGALLLVAPGRVGARDARARALLRGAGAAMAGGAAVTDWELGLTRRLPVRAHLAADAVQGAVLLASPWLLRLRRRGPGAWLPVLLVGGLELGAAALTDPRDELQRAAQEPPSAPGRTAPVPGAPTEQADHRPGPLTTPAGDVPGAAQVEGLLPLDAPAPVEAPGPSVPAGGPPASTTEVEERVQRTLPDPEALGVAGADPIDQLAAREEAAAAAEAAAIGGAEPRPAADAELDPSMRPVYEAGGGEQEGFELAETELIENASHGEGHGNPLRDALAPEAESDRSTADFAEPDQEVDGERAAREDD